MNFNDHTLTWDNDIIPNINERHTYRTLSSAEALIEVYMSANEPQTLRDKNSRAIQILDAEYEPAILDDVIKTCENLHVEEQHQIKTLLQKYDQGSKNKKRTTLVYWYSQLLSKHVALQK
jgi:hypothetical protein